MSDKDGNLEKGPDTREVLTGDKPRVSATEEYLRRSMPDVIAQRDRNLAEAGNEMDDSKLAPKSSKGVDAPKPKPAEKILGKFDTVQDLEKAYQASESALGTAQQNLSSAKPAVELAGKYETLLKAVDGNPELRKHIVNFYSKEQTPDMRREVDEDGDPTGNLTLSPNQLSNMIQQEVQKAVQSAKDDVQREQNQQQEVAEFEAQVRKQYPDVSDEALKEFYEKVKSGQVTLMDIYSGVNRGLGEAAAENRGRTEVVDQVERVQNMTPSLGTVAGHVEVDQSLEEAMADDIVAIGRKKQLATELGF
jgi:hypothetical protein